MHRSAGNLSFPPLLPGAQWKGASQGRKFPGGDHTWKKSLAPRPLAHMPDKQTVQDIQTACGGKFDLLSRTVQLPADLVSREGTPLPRPGHASTRPGQRMPLYDSVWPDTTAPTFSVWDYCKKVGHAPPPNSLPAPRVNDMKSWFATYGTPTPNAPPGVRSEFSSTNKCIPHGEGEASRQVRMYKGRVLK